MGITPNISFSIQRVVNHNDISIAIVGHASPSVKIVGKPDIQIFKLPNTPYLEVYPAVVWLSESNDWPVDVEVMANVDWRIE